MFSIEPESYVCGGFNLPPVTTEVSGGQFLNANLFGRFFVGGYLALELDKITVRKGEII